jgi:hypothetical protein
MEFSFKFFSYYCEASFTTSATLNTVVNCVGFEVLIAVIIHIAVLWEKAPCSTYVNRRFGGTYHLHLQGRKSAKQETSV